MKSLFKFIISPYNNEQYINTKMVGDTEIIINTSIEEAVDVQRKGVVKALPLTYKGDVLVGDTVIVQHNVFRITYNDNGVPMQSGNHIKDNLFYVSPDLVYMVIRDGKKMAIDQYVFVEPVKEIDSWLGEIESSHIGIIKYSNRELREKGINDGDMIVFRKFTEYEFLIDDERLYLMGNHRILAKLNNN